MKQCTSLADAITAVISAYGAEILKDGNCFCAIMGDIAPALGKEQKIVRRAKDEGVFSLIYEAYSSDAIKRTNLLAKIEYVLKTEAGFSEDWCHIMISSFSKAFSWEKQPDNLDESEEDITFLELLEEILRKADITDSADLC